MALTDKQRTNLVDKARYLISKASQIDYEAVRPMLTRGMSWGEITSKLNRGGRIAMDCSESVTQLYHWCGLRDPSNFGFNGFGNSHTMWQHLANRYTDPADAHPGAICVYGFQGGEHVTMVMEHDPNGNPMLFSHGSEIGPLFISLANESAAHRGQARIFLDVSKL